ncbi:MAG TPA: terminase family protein [Verrucomicrobiae bacterium]
MSLRPYQADAFHNREHGIECWLWGRQTGKSYTLAAWAVDRLVTRPGRLVTILSNSLSNGIELNQKCAEIARLYECAFEQSGTQHVQFETMNLEIRLSVAGAVSRIKILPANPRTARGFSGDLILDEFAFHENSAAIWEAAEPILAANPDYLCRIASTPNGRHNMFYRLVTDPAIPTRIVRRSDAWREGLVISHPSTRQPITPEQARELAIDKRAYDQNYECVFESENMSLLTLDLISQAEDESVGLICDDLWSEQALSLLHSSAASENGGATLLRSFPENSKPNTPPFASAIAFDMGQHYRGGVGNAENSKLAPPRNFYIGVDVGRTHDLTVISVVEKAGDMFLVRAILRLRNMRLPAQQELLEVACRSPRFAAAQIDMTGLGLGLFEYTHQRFGDRVRGLNFSSSIPLPHFAFRRSHFEFSRVRAPEALALGLLQAYEGKRIRHPMDALLREDLRKPERITNNEGRVSIVAAQTKDGHADHFWSLALAIDAAMRSPAPQIYVPRLRNLMRIPRNKFI